MWTGASPHLCMRLSCNVSGGHMATMLVGHARSACCTSHSYRVAWLGDRPFLGQLEEFAPAASARSDPFWFVLQDHPTGPHSSALYKAMAANHTSSLCFVHSVAQHPKGKGSHTASGANLLLCWCDVVSGCRVTPVEWLAKAGACQHHLAHCFATCTLCGRLSTQWCLHATSQGTRF